MDIRFGILPLPKLFAPCVVLGIAFFVIAGAAKQTYGTAPPIWERSCLQVGDSTTHLKCGDEEITDSNATIVPALLAAKGQPITCAAYRGRGPFGEIDLLCKAAEQGQ